MRFFLIVGSFLLGQILFAQNTEEWNYEDFFESFFEEIYTQLDKEKLDNYFSEDALILENGVVYDLKEFESKVDQMRNQFDEEAKSGYEFQRKNELEFIEFRKHEKSLWISLKNSASFTVGETTIAELNSLVSAFLIEKGGNWKIQMYHMSLIN